MSEKLPTKPDLRPLLSALSRVSSAQEWATAAKLLNVGGELRQAANEISYFLDQYPARAQALPEERE